MVQLYRREYPNTELINGISLLLHSRVKSMAGDTASPRKGR